MSCLEVMGDDLQFSRGVQLELREATREVIQVVPLSDLLKGGLEILYRSLVMIQLRCQDQDRHAEEISRLEHELSETLGNLKQSLVANSEYAEMLARETAEKKKAQQGVTEAEHHVAEVEAEVATVMTENTRLKRMLGEREDKISTLGVR